MGVKVSPVYFDKGPWDEQEEKTFVGPGPPSGGPSTFYPGREGAFDLEYSLVVFEVLTWRVVGPQWSHRESVPTTQRVFPLRLKENTHSGSTQS